MEGNGCSADCGGGRDKEQMATEVMVELMEGNSCKADGDGGGADGRTDGA